MEISRELRENINWTNEITALGAELWVFCFVFLKSCFVTFHAWICSQSLILWIVDSCAISSMATIKPNLHGGIPFNLAVSSSCRQLRGNGDLSACLTSDTAPTCLFKSPQVNTDAIMWFTDVNVCYFQLRVSEFPLFPSDPAVFLSWSFPWRTWSNISGDETLNGLVQTWTDLVIC